MLHASLVKDGMVGVARPVGYNRAGQWSVRISGNRRVVCRFEGGETVDVDLIDYH